MCKSFFCSLYLSINCRIMLRWYVLSKCMHSRDCSCLCIGSCLSVSFWVVVSQPRRPPFYEHVFFPPINWFTWQASFCSFMPIHIGAETDLRFVYCAGEEHCPLFTLGWIFCWYNLAHMICLFSCNLLNAKWLDRNGQVKGKGIHFELPGWFLKA